MAYKQKNNPLTTPILKVEMDNNVMGKANKDGSIHINKNISDPKEIQDIVEHESVHLDQMQRGDLDYDDNNVIWKGKKYSRNDMKEGAKNLPWEKEAYQKTEGSKGFKLNNHRGNNDSYKSFQDKGLVSPLNKNPGLFTEADDQLLAAQNKPAFGIKEWLNKDNRVTVDKSNKPVLDPNRKTGAFTPDLWSQADKDYIQSLNDEQRTKSLSTGFLSSASGDTSSLAQPNILNSPTPGSGWDKSATPSEAANEGFFNDQTGAQALAFDLTEIAAKDQAAYKDDPNYAYQDYRGSSDPKSQDADGNFIFGDLTDSADDTDHNTTPKGYYNVNTGEKAPELDMSARLASSNILSPESYNIMEDNSQMMGPTGAMIAANRRSGDYTTNYKLNKGDRIPDKYMGYSTKESKAITKGQSAKWSNNPSKQRKRTGIAGMLGLGFNADKKEKTLLPKRKLVYGSDDQGNQTVTKTWDRLKYNTKQKFYNEKGSAISEEDFNTQRQRRLDATKEALENRQENTDELAALRNSPQ